MECIVGGVYRHYRTQGLYRVIALAKDHESLEPQVVYRQLYGRADMHIRPLAVFTAMIDDATPRFAFVQSFPLLDFDTYQAESRTTAQYPDMGRNPLFPTLGIAGEAGEVVEKVKKVWGVQDGVYTADDRRAVAKELGDVLWYMAQLATELHLSLQDIACMNIEKIRQRQRTSTIYGDGDNREQSDKKS